MRDDCQIARKTGLMSPWISAPAPKRSRRPCNIDLEEWGLLVSETAEEKIRFYSLDRRSSLPVALLVSDPDTETIFRDLVSRWKEETWFLSSIKKRIAHPAYLQIIGLGGPAVPLILEELRRDPDYWSYALEAITREDPIPQADNLGQLRDAWLEWGKANGY